MRPLRPLLMATTGTLLLSLTLPGASTTAATVSTPIGTVTVESHGTAPTPSDGDLWPSCWAGNDKLYTANGDGKGFSTDQPFADVAVSEVNGAPPNLSGTTVARGDQVGQIWSGAGYNRKRELGGGRCADRVSGVPG